jgi:predicted transcriptional regulator
MLDKREIDVLKLFGERKVMRRTEVRRIVGAAADAVLEALVEKGLLTKIAPLGETTYAITNKGTKVLDELME